LEILRKSTKIRVNSEIEFYDFIVFLNFFVTFAVLLIFKQNVNHEKRLL